jgi:hypothetical protein
MGPFVRGSVATAGGLINYSPESAPDAHPTRLNDHQSVVEGLASQGRKLTKDELLARFR